jgi:hypothetical protein
VRALAGEGLWRREGFYYLLTATAPGARAHCKRGGCSGDGVNCPHERCRCTPPGGVDLAEWNPTAGKRWNRLRSSLSAHYSVNLDYFRAVEVQEGEHRDDGIGRGALHLHVLVWSPRKLDLRTVRRLAVLAGFGHSLKLDALAPGSKKAAYYVSKYVTKSADSRDLVPWSVDEIDSVTGEVERVPGGATYRTWSQTRGWGTTMKAIREVARRRWVERASSGVALVGGLGADSELAADLLPGVPV